jgi:sigma-E factor negative regulatory protein RseB
MSGARSEVIRDGDTVICEAPAPARVLSKGTSTRLLPLVPDTQGAKFAKLYSVVGRGDDRVAGYAAQVVEIRPQDTLRYGYRLWLDQETHLLLRSAIVDASGRALEQFMFVALEIGAKPNESDLAPGAHTEAEVPPDEIRVSGPPTWLVADLPAGFSLRAVQRPAQAPTRAEHQVYSDGIATVSVYVEPRDALAAVPVDSASTFGAISICAHAERDWKFTAVGDVPPVTVQRMVRSLQPLSAQRGKAQAP